MTFIMEADGGSRGNPGPAGYGALVRDAATGEVLAEAAAAIGTATNNVAEYRGLIAGLEAVRELDPTATVEVRMDSKLVVEQMSGRWQIKHPDMRPLALQARGILPAGQVSYRWIPREQNRDADRLANEAMDAAAAGRTWERRRLPPGGRMPADDGEPHAAPDLPATVEGARIDEAEVDPVPQNKLMGWADLGPPTKLVLLRHGITEHTVEKVFSGSGGEDPPLLDIGRDQAALAGAALAARVEEPAWHGMTKVHRVIASPLRRTRETAEIAAAALGVPVDIEPGLAECAFGKWDGSTLGEVQRTWPEEFERWLASPAVPAPGGESFDDVAARVRIARDRLVRDYPRQTLLLVSHVTPIKQLVRLALGAPPTALYRMELQPASLSVLDWYADGNASLRCFNEVIHLR